ncbi:hypothetical protein N8987_06800 [Crocinitomix sp.]|nr:hypothetical protein [Crocinitomix sp.]
MKFYLLLILSILLVSCSKTPILESSEAMVGTWKHYYAVGNSHTLYIFEDGSGKIEWEDNDEVSKATKVRDWYLEDNTLYFGKAAFNGESYTIEEYPRVAWEELIVYYDTIPETKKYIVLDGDYYTEQ